MKYQLMTISFGLVTLFFLLSVPRGIAQKNADQWLRMVTGEESVIDVDRSSLVLEQNRVIGAKFKTTLLKSESIPGKPDFKYQARLDSIQFNIKDSQYRIFESTLFDESGKVVSSYSSNTAESWKALRSRTGRLLFNAASQLAPFGIWKVLTYHYVSGDPPSKDDPSELRSLIGNHIRLDLDRVQVGLDRVGCLAPVFEPKTITNDEFVKRVGSPLKSLGISMDKVEAIILNCDGSDQFPTQTFILRLPDGKALMFWDGVFLEIERPGNPFLP